MCNYCGYYPQYYSQPYQYYSPNLYYSPYQYFGPTYAYPQYMYPYYGLSSGYAITLPSPPMSYTMFPQWQRGEHRVGNCLMVCQ